jgi:hypothetical protein
MAGKIISIILIFLIIISCNNRNRTSPKTKKKSKEFDTAEYLLNMTINSGMTLEYLSFLEDSLRNAKPIIDTQYNDSFCIINDKNYKNRGRLYTKTIKFNLKDYIHPKYIKKEEDKYSNEIDRFRISKCIFFDNYKISKINSYFIQHPTEVFFNSNFKNNKIFYLQFDVFPGSCFKVSKISSKNEIYKYEIIDSLTQLAAHEPYLNSFCFSPPFKFYYFSLEMENHITYYFPKTKPYWD